MWLTVVNDRGFSAAAAATLNVFARPAFTDYANTAGFHLPIPVDWAREENVDVGGFTYQLVLTGPSANGHSTRIGVETDPLRLAQTLQNALGAGTDDFDAQERRLRWAEDGVRVAGARAADHEVNVRMRTWMGPRCTGRFPVTPPSRL